MKILKEKVCGDKDCNETFKPYSSFQKYCSFDCDYKNKKKPKKKKKHISPVSKKRAEELAVYRPLRDKYMEDNEVCEVKGCKRLSNDLHHKAKRGNNLSDVNHFMAVCRPHHTWIHENPKESRELGYLI